MNASDRNGPSAPTSRVALLGTGTMGAGMARNLAAAGLEVRVWNRSRERAEALADVATVSDSVEAAVDGVDVIVTMLYDADSVADCLTPALAGLDGDARPAADAVWLQTTTVGVAGAERLAALAEKAGLDYLDAPVLGTKKPAEDGTLVVLASGEEGLRDRVAPVLDAVGSRTMWVGPAGAGSRLKLACNAWVATVVEGVAQSLRLAETLGVDPQLFLDAVAGGALDAPYVGLKGGAMLRGELDASFQLAGGLKDVELMLEAVTGTQGAEGWTPSLLPAIRDRWQRGVDQGLGDLDLAATYRTDASEPTG